MKWILKYPRAFFLILSLFFWIGNRLSQQRVKVELGYDLQYTGFDPELVKAMPQRLQIRWAGAGYSSWKEWTNPFRSITLDRKSLDRELQEWTSGFYIDQLRTILQKASPEDLELLSLADGDRFVTLPDWKAEWWPVDKHLPDGLLQEGLIVELSELPDSLKGLRLADFQEKEKGQIQLEYDGVFPELGSHSIRLRASVPTSSTFQLSEEFVQASVKVSQVTTLYRQVPIEHSGSSDCLVVPAQLRMAFTIPLELWERLETESIRAYLQPSEASTNIIRIEMDELLARHLTYSSHDVARLIQISS
jgi:hypothetical protein